jgi:hypothetical protein
MEGRAPLRIFGGCIRAKIEKILGRLALSQVPYHRVEGGGAIFIGVMDVETVCNQQVYHGCVNGVIIHG